jgi:hypothetical protein
MAPIGIVTDGSTGAQFGQIWFVFTFIGASVGLTLLARTGAIWSELEPTAQSGIAAVVLLFLATFHGLLGLVPVSLVGGAHALVRLLPEGWGALLCAAHWSALAVFAQRVSLPPSGKLLALACVGWWLPALVSDLPAWERMTWALSPARHLESRAFETSFGRLVDTIPILAWWVAAALLPTRSAFKR